MKKKRVYNQVIPSYLAPNLNNLDAFHAHKYSVQWSQAPGSKNRIMEMLGGYLFLALDWNSQTESI